MLEFQFDRLNDECKTDDGYVKTDELGVMKESRSKDAARGERRKRDTDVVDVSRWFFCLIEVLIK